MGEVLDRELQELNLKRREQELARREKELAIAEKNIEVMKHIAYAEHLSQTQTIAKVSTQVVNDLTEKGHICVNGERITRIEGKLDLVLERQSDIKEDINKKHEEVKADIKTLFDGRNSNADRIGTLEAGGKASIKTATMIGIFITNFLTLLIAAIALCVALKEGKDAKTRVDAKPSIEVTQYKGE